MIDVNGANLTFERIAGIKKVLNISLVIKFIRLKKVRLTSETSLCQ